MKLTSGLLLAEAWARLLSRPLRILALQLLIFAPALAGLLVALRGLVLAADAWLAPQKTALPKVSIALMIGGLILFIAAHLLVRPIAERTLAAIALEQPVRATWREVFGVQLRRWALPWILVIAPLALGARFVIVLSVLGALDARSLIGIGALVVWVGFLAAGVAIWMHLRAAMGFAAITSGARDALLESAEKMKQNLGPLLVLGAILISIDLALAWIAAELVGFFTTRPAIVQLSAAELRARLDQLEPVQAWIFAATQAAAMFTRSLGSLSWARAWAHVRGTSATPT